MFPAQPLVCVAVPLVSQPSFAARNRRPYLGEDGGRSGSAGQGERRGPDPAALPADALAEGRGRAQGAGNRRRPARARGQGGRARHALRLQGDHRPHVGRRRCVRGGRGPGRRLRDRPIRRGPRRQSSQRLVRKGRATCRAKARRPRLPPRPRSQPALPPRAAHRLADQDRRAGHEEHRHDALFPPLQHRPDDHRAGRDLRHLLRQVRRRAWSRRRWRWSRSTSFSRGR